MTNTQIAKLYLAINSSATAAQIDSAVTDGTALVSITALSATDFLEASYQAAFGRSVDADGTAAYLTKLTDGTLTQDAFAAILVAGAAIYPADGAFVTTAANDVVVAVNKAAADTASAAISVGEAATIVATVTEVATTVTAAATAVAAVVAANAPATGETYALTTANQVIESGTGNDTFTDGIASDTAAAVTLNVSDIIIDASTTDNDTMSVEWSGTTITDAVTITNVENINVNIDSFSLGGVAFDATNVTGANITLSSDKLGFDGAAAASTVANNTITAGDAVTALTVTGLTGGSIDAGSAATVAMTGTASRANTVTVNGDLALTNTTSTLTTLDVTAASDVTYTSVVATLQTTVTGDNDLNLTMANAAVVVGASIVKDTTGAINLIDDGAAAVSAMNTTGFDVDKIMVGAATTSTTVTIASGQTIETNANNATLEAITTTLSADTVNINAAHNITTLILDDGAAATADLTSTINATRVDGVTIGTLTATAQNVILTGSVDFTATGVDVATLDASAATGDITLTTVGTVTETITTGSGTATITTGGTGDNLTVNAGAGGTTTNAILVHTGIVSVEGSTGSDTIEMAILGAATIAFNGAGGSDSIILGDAGADASTTAAAVWAVENVESIVIANTAVAAASLSVNDAVDALGASMNASQLNAKTYIVSQEEALDTVTLTVAGDVANIPSTTAQTIDLSGITMQTDDSTVINGEASIANTITGTNVADTITAGVSTTAAQVNTLTGGAGDDVFVFAAGDSLEATINSITDYQAAALASDNDTLDVGLAGTATYLDATDSISDISTNLSATVTTIFADAVNAVDAVVSNTGIMTLVGTTSDKALANTLAEWIDIAEETMLHATGNATAVTDVMAFEFEGDTYVLSVPATGASDIVELTGLTGVTGISNAAAADGIFIL